MDRQVYKCECGYVTHFEKALEAHCRFRHHHPAQEQTVKAEPETILPEIEAELTKAVKRQAKAKKEENTAETMVAKKATTRKPRAKKTAVNKES